VTKLFGSFSALVILSLVCLMALSAIPATMPTTHPVDELDLWATGVMLDCQDAENAGGYMLGYAVRGKATRRQQTWPYCVASANRVWQTWAGQTPRVQAQRPHTIRYSNERRCMVRNDSGNDKRPGINML